MKLFQLYKAAFVGTLLVVLNCVGSLSVQANNDGASADQGTQGGETKPGECRTGGCSTDPNVSNRPAAVNAGSGAPSAGTNNTTAKGLGSESSK